MLRGQAVAAPWKAWGLRCVTAVLQMDKRPSAGACGVNYAPLEQRGGMTMRASSLRRDLGTSMPVLGQGSKHFCSSNPPPSIQGQVFLCVQEALLCLMCSPSPNMIFTMY